LSFASLAQWWKGNTDVKKPKDNLQVMNFQIHSYLRKYCLFYATV